MKAKLLKNARAFTHTSLGSCLWVLCVILKRILRISVTRWEVSREMGCVCGSKTHSYWSFHCTSRQLSKAAVRMETPPSWKRIISVRAVMRSKTGITLDYMTSCDLFKLGAELWPECSHEEHEAQFIKLSTRGIRPADTGWYALYEATHEPDGNKGDRCELSRWSQMQLIASENDTVLGIALFQSPVLLFVIITFTRHENCCFHRYK